MIICRPVFWSKKQLAWPNISLFFIFLFFRASYRCGVFYAGALGEKPIKALYVVPKRFPFDCDRAEPELIEAAKTECIDLVSFHIDWRLWSFKFRDTKLWRFLFQGSKSYLVVWVTFWILWVRTVTKVPMATKFQWQQNFQLQQIAAKKK